MIYSTLTFPEGDSRDRRKDWFKLLWDLLIEGWAMRPSAALITFLHCLGNIPNQKNDLPPMPFAVSSPSCLAYRAFRCCFFETLTVLSCKTEHLFHDNSFLHCLCEFCAVQENVSMPALLHVKRLPHTEHETQSDDWQMGSLRKGEAFFLLSVRSLNQPQTKIGDRHNAI